jgi:tetratricopeptide (TPR) repeat protein
MAMLAGLHFQSGEKGEGTEVVERLVGRAPDELWPYQVGLDAMSGAGMRDEMIDFIIRARGSVGDSTVFAVDAARIYRDQGRFGAATREYLRAGVARNMSSEIATDYIVTMAKSAEARAEIIAALKRAASIAPFSQTVTRSLAAIYLMDMDCPGALEMISELVMADPESSSMLVAFARKASAAGCFGECARAYEIVLRFVDTPNKVAEYLVEKARCEVEGGMVDRAMGTYEEVARKYRSYKAADDALMERAVILRDRGDLNGAIAEAERVMASKYADNVFRAILFRGGCEVLMDDLEAALETYDRVGEEWPAEFAQEAYFNMGEISLYRGEFEDAEGYYNVTLRHYPDEARANDAIDRLLLIKGSGGGGAYASELKDLGRALLLWRQGEVEEAEEMLRALGGSENGGSVRGESLKALAGLYIEEGYPEEAIETYRLIGDSLDTEASPSALEAIGDIYLDQGRTEEAIQAYEDVILKFPGSVSAGDARRKIDIANRGTDDNDS